MKSNRDEAIRETLRWEGGYSNHSSDPGGPTNWGITIHDARKYWKKGATASDVKNMPKEVAVGIYVNKYWKTPYYDCDNLASGVDLAVFDFGVNSGPSRAKRFLDKAVGGSSQDTITKICDARLAWLKTLRTWPTFGIGWGRRVAGIKRKSLEMANRSKVTAETSTAGGAIIAGGAAATQAPINWVPWIIGGTIALAIISWLLVRWLRKDK